MISEMLAQEKVKNALRKAEKDRLVTMATQTRHTQIQKRLQFLDWLIRLFKQT